MSLLDGALLLVSWQQGERICDQCQGVMLQAGHYGGLIRPAPVQSRRHLIKITVLAAAFLLSVVLNNVALRFIPVSFVEVKSSHREMPCLLNCRIALA